MINDIDDKEYARLQHEGYIDHEVRIRLQDEKHNRLKDYIKNVRDDLRESIRHIDTKLDSQFKWTIGIMITMFGGLIITKLI